ncbi:uncharacterized protein LOC127801259 [Diospyros lotus]|uniref:uncharacterized protein LOC127801259 n=1 Tax=Diospyros lotus TaxID=55363 RepID=UPI00225082C9|nr:uncharacterized protein LOC127801259 [Diospyros lotus]
MNQILTKNLHDGSERQGIRAPIRLQGDESKMGDLNLDNRNSFPLLKENRLPNEDPLVKMSALRKEANSMVMRSSDRQLMDRSKLEVTPFLVDDLVEKEPMGMIPPMETMKSLPVERFPVRQKDRSTFDARSAHESGRLERDDRPPVAGSNRMEEGRRGRDGPRFEKGGSGRPRSKDPRDLAQIHWPNNHLNDQSYKNKLRPNITSQAHSFLQQGPINRSHSRPPVQPINSWADVIECHIQRVPTRLEYFPPSDGDCSRNEDG